VQTVQAVSRVQYKYYQKKWEHIPIRIGVIRLPMGFYLFISPGC